MSRFFETIRITDGQIMHPRWHEIRMLRTTSFFYGISEAVKLKEILSIPDEFRSGIVRCRVDYDREINTVEFFHYRLKNIRKIQLINANEIEYPFKFSDRSGIEELLKKKGDADEIIIVKNDQVTDTSFSNLIFFDGKDWYTPSTPLLNGTCRQRLLVERKIRKKDIRTGDLRSFEGLKLINAMIYPEDSELLPVKNVIFPSYSSGTE